VTSKPVRYVGNPDFHDGHIRAISQTEEQVLVTVEGYSGKRYTICFDGVSSMESYSPQDMEVYGLAEADGEVELVHRYEFVNSCFGEAEEEKSTSYLRIFASKFSVADSD
jgi:hypothetical protein